MLKDCWTVWVQKIFNPKNVYQVYQGQKFLGRILHLKMSLAHPIHVNLSLMNIPRKAAQEQRCKKSVSRIPDFLEENKDIFY